MKNKNINNNIKNENSINKKLKFKKVNQKKMNELSEIGEIDKEDIEGCYELKEAEGYLKISVKELENEE